MAYRDQTGHPAVINTSTPWYQTSQKSVRIKSRCVCQPDNWYTTLSLRGTLVAVEDAPHRICLCIELTTTIDLMVELNDNWSTWIIFQQLIYMEDLNKLIHLDDLLQLPINVDDFQQFIYPCR